MGIAGRSPLLAINAYNFKMQKAESSAVVKDTADKRSMTEAEIVPGLRVQYKAEEDYGGIKTGCWGTIIKASSVHKCTRTTCN